MNDFSFEVLHSGVTYTVYPPNKTYEGDIWCIVERDFPYNAPSGRLRKAIKKKATNIMKELTTYGYDDMIPLSVPHPQEAPAKDLGQKNPGKRKKNMCYDCDTPMTEAQLKREHLTSRLYQEQETKYDELRRAFGLQDDPYPTSYADFLQRIKDGKYVISEESLKKNPYAGYSYANVIRWRDPALKEDEDGFKAATKKLDAAYRDAEDIIVVFDEKAGLEALKAFEAKTFH